MRNKYIYGIIFTFLLFVAAAPSPVDAQDMADYTAYPAFVSNAVVPNILLLLDQSGSMQYPAFYDCDFDGYSAKRAKCGVADSISSPELIYLPTYDYYGYFKNDKYYNYGSNKFEENAACVYAETDPEYRIGDNTGCISGNLLNWASMSRIDLLRKALLGGKSASQQTNAHTLRGEGGWWTYSDHTLGCTFELSGGSFPQLAHTLNISDYASTGILTVKASGSIIWGTSDSFRYIYQPVSGDFDVKLRIISPSHETEQTFAKAGLMVRTSTATGSQHVKAMATHGSGLQFSERAVNDGDTTLIGNYVPTNYPIWVRIMRTGNDFSYFYSSDGTTWTLHGTSTVVMPNNLLVGMASASYANSSLGTFEYDDFTCSLCTDDDFSDEFFDTLTWTALDINTAVAGSQEESTSTCAVGSLVGADIQVDVPEHEKRGVIQIIADRDGDGAFDDDAPRFGLMVYAGDNRYGCMMSGIGATMASLVTALQNEPPYNSTPTGEAFQEAWDYYIQSDVHTGCNNNAYIGGPGSNKDPWCDDGNPVDCRKSYVLHVSDGEWDGSVDPVEPARLSHTNDIRTDAGMEGNQSLIYYNLYIFGDEDNGRNAMQQASMYGAFDDYDGNTWPYDRTGYPADSRYVSLPAAPCEPYGTMHDRCKEWDKNEDGIPDTYYESSGGNRLEASLMEAISDIMKHASSGTAASVLATTGGGEGAVYQAYFYPKKLENLEFRKWLGYVHGLFVDKYGNLREDTVNTGTLDMAGDMIVQMEHDDDLGSIVNRYTDLDADGVKDSEDPVSTVPLDNLKTIWNGGEVLWRTDPSARTIFTTTDGFTRRDFSPDDVTATLLEPYIRANGLAESKNIINWVMGYDLPNTTDNGHPTGYRKRTITKNIDGVDVTDVWKLGNIVYSTPTVSARPMENYHLIYGDEDYAYYWWKHYNRRHVVFAGANDGMLHAFNAGCYNDSLHKFFTDEENGQCTSNSTMGSHKLGEELWAFIPRGILPHLKWQTDPDYTHVYTVDLKPKITDIDVFDEDTDHVRGWGTILIGGFRYGGKKIRWTAGGGDYVATPEYFALDVTNPLEPRLLWTFPENRNLDAATFMDPELGLSMSYPAIAKVGDKWFAIFGSGATDYDQGSNLTAFHEGNIFVLDISSGTNGRIERWDLGTNYWKLPTGNASVFMSRPATVDVDINYDVDVFYIGENYREGSTWNANMLRVRTELDPNPANWAPTLSPLASIDAIDGNSRDYARRITAAPSIAMDDRANLWVYFGTGQFLGSNDKNLVDTGAFYGIKEKCGRTYRLSNTNGSYYCENSVSANELMDVSRATVSYSTGQVSGVSGGCASADSEWSSILSSSYSDQCHGWSMFFGDLIESEDFLGNTLNHQGERIITRPIVLGGLISIASYIPGVDECSSLGESNVYSGYFQTGTAYKKYVFKDQKEQEARSDTVARVKQLGKGMPSSISAQVTKSGNVKGFIDLQGDILEIESISPYRLQSGVAGCSGDEIP